MKCKDCTNYICNHRTSDAEKDCFFEKQMVLGTSKLFLDFIDWEKFRREAAKDILCAVIQNDGIDGRASEYVKNCVMVSLFFTDELIKQLKEKEEK